MMLMTKSFRTLIATAALAVLAGAAQAATINFNTYHSGLNVGATTLGTLGATQVGADVEFVYTNTAAGFVPGHTTQLFLTYAGSQVAVTLSNISGVATDSFDKKASFVNAGLTFQFEIGWPTSNKDDLLRLNPGETSTFRLLNTTLAGFFQGSNSAMIHIQGLTGDASAKYLGSGSTTVIPLPAGGWLMLAGFGALAALRRRRRA